ncbi:MAG: hypothetical protein ACK5N0_07435 [Synechococcaceae cyanobacterium]
MVLEGVDGEGGGVLPPARPAALEAEAATDREPEPVLAGEERTGPRRLADWALAAAERLVEGVTRRLVLPRTTGCDVAGVVLELVVLAGAGAVASGSGVTAAAWGSGGKASGFRLASLVSGNAVSGGGGGVSAPGAGVSVPGAGVSAPRAGVSGTGAGDTGLLAASVSGAIGTSWLATVIVVAPTGWDLAEARVRERRGAGAMESGGSRTGEAGETTDLSRRETSGQ